MEALPALEKADDLVAQIDAGRLRPHTHKVCRALAGAMPIRHDEHRAVLATFDCGEADEETLRERLWSRIASLPLAAQGSLRTCVALLNPDAPVDWHHAEYLIQWGREAGLSDATIIRAFGMTTRDEKIAIRKATSADLPRALEIWRAAVDATHRFLTPEDRAEIDVIVERDYLPDVDLWVATDAAGAVQGFLGMGADEIDSLFVDPAVHGQGYGSALVAHALALVPGAKVDANEQASNAVAFYEGRGFVRTGRSETDLTGRPYPLIHFRHPGGVL